MEVSLQSHWIFVFHNFISVPTSFFCQQQWHLRDLLAHVYDPRVLTIEECNGIYTGKKHMFRVQCVDMVFVFCKEGMNSHFLFLSLCLLQCVVYPSWKGFSSALQEHQQVKQWPSMVPTTKLLNIELSYYGV